MGFLGTGVLRKISIVLAFCMLVVPAAADEPLKLLIFPLSGSREGVNAWTGEGVALSLSGQLTDDKTGPFSRGEIEDLLIENGLPADAPLSRGSMIYVAEQAGADFVIAGNYTENGDSLKLSVLLFDMKTRKQGSEFTVSGTFATLPEMENELAWMVYSTVVRPPVISRGQFRERARRIPNSVYAGYVESLNEFEESRQIQMLEKVVKEYADFPEARFQIGRLYYQKRDYARALPHIEYGRRLQGERLQSEFMIGTCLLQMSEAAKAVEVYTRLISQIRHTTVMNNLAVAHVRNGDNVQALRMLADARARERDDPAIAINLAIARYLAGDAPAAMKFVEETIADYPGNGMLYFLSSFMMGEAGNEARAAADTARAERFGVNVNRLLREKPQTWMRVILNWTNE
jgi:tetratricopeptide (TPR) repeat protein